MEIPKSKLLNTSSNKQNQTDQQGENKGRYPLFMTTTYLGDRLHENREINTQIQ